MALPWGSIIVYRHVVTYSVWKLHLMLGFNSFESFGKLVRKSPKRIGSPRKLSLPNASKVIPIEGFQGYFHRKLRVNFQRKFRRLSVPKASEVISNKRFAPTALAITSVTFHITLTKRFALCFSSLNTTSGCGWSKWSTLFRWIQCWTTSFTLEKCPYYY